MRTFPLNTLAVSLGLFLRKIRNYFRIETSSKKADDSPDIPSAKQRAITEPSVAKKFSDEPHRAVWGDCGCCWVVVCKNHWFHRKRNLFKVHRIPLGAADTAFTRPAIKQHFVAQCDECFKEYVYKPSEVLRWEMEAPTSFVPHQLFRE
jgi:hypothetical protein